MTTKGKLIFGLLAVGAGFLTWKYLQRKEQKTLLPPDGGSKAKPIPVSNFTSGFPLQKGSRGPQVQALQKKILSKGGAIAALITTTGGADGIWGPGTDKAFKVAGYPAVINEKTWGIIVNGGIKIMP